MNEAFERHLAHVKFRKDAEKAETLEQKIAFCRKFLAQNSTLDPAKPDDWIRSREPKIWTVQKDMSEFEEFELSMLETAEDRAKRHQYEKDMLLRSMIQDLNDKELVRWTTTRNVIVNKVSIRAELGVYKL